MSTFNWTPSQELAIQFDKPERLLISAAAGSGKTAVLTERITVRALSNLVKPSRLLVMTFTELAASKMKTKIMSRFRTLRDATTDANERDRLDRLIRELPLARISTIHAFCNHIISSFLADLTDADGKPYLEPGYRILQGAEEHDLSDDAIDTVLTTLYAELDRLEQHEANLRASVIASTDSDRPEIRRTVEERDFYAVVPRGVPDLSDEVAPFVLGGRDCSYADWLRDFKTISLAYAPGLDDRPLRSAITSMLEQLRNLPHYERLIANAYDSFIVEATSFPNGIACQYWWTLFEETLQTAASALEELRHTNHYIRLYEPSTKKKAKHLIDLAHATDEMERVVTSLGRSSGRTEEHWNAIVHTGQALDELQLPNFGPSTSTNEAVIDKNDYLDQFFREVLPLAALISNKVNRNSARNKQYISQHPPIFTVFAEEARNSMLNGAGPVARFLEVTLLVDNEYKRKRFERNAILFSDIEHGALAILEKDDIGENISQLYDEIYIDEYQDTSSIQDAIIAAIDRRNVFMVGDIKQSIYLFRYANPQLFTARAQTSQVIEPGKPIVPLSSQQEGYLSLMNRNFRSRPGIIEFVNDFFSAFLTEAVGEIEYDETQMFEAHRSRAEQTEEKNPRHFPEVSWEIATNIKELDSDDDRAEDEATTSDSPPLELTVDMPDSKAKAEALMAARVIGELLDAGAKPESIAILLPTNDHCRQFEEVLSASGITVASRSGRIFPDNLVSRQVEALLAVLDNPQQDIPLLSTMIGPFAPEPFTSEELARIGQEEIMFDHSEKKDDHGEDIDKRVNVFFHDRLRHLCKRAKASDIAIKYDLFTERMKKWRMLATELNARELLDTIFLESDYLPYISRGELGPSHYRELEQLIALFETPDRPNSFGIRSMLDQLRKALGEPIKDETESRGLAEGAVHVLTRHSSKGLDWDYVLLGGLDRRGRGDRHDNLISYSEQNGLSSYTIDEGGLSVYNNALNQAFRLSEEKRFRAESWRLLYVAMTRAKERLILLSPAKKTLIDRKNIQALLREANHLTSHLSTNNRTGRAVVPESLSARTKTDLELLLSVLAVRDPERTKETVSASEGLFEFSHLSTRVTPFSEILVAIEDRKARTHMIDGIDKIDHTEAESIDSRTDDDVVEKIKYCLSKDVPHKEAADTPAKVTVTELNKRLRDDTIHQPLASGESPEPMPYVLRTQIDHENEEGKAAVATDISRSDMALTMREREEEQQIKGASLGTLMHYIFQFIDLEELALQTADAEQACRSQLQLMAKTNMITHEEKQAALPFVPQIIAWAKSPLAERLLSVEKTTGRVYREIPFTMAIASSELHERFPDDEITLAQGMIDLWFEEDNNRAVLIDFKTDYLTFSTPEKADDEIRRRYTTQIRYYADAIKKATGCDVSEAFIWLVRYARAVSISLD